MLQIQIISETDWKMNKKSLTTVQKIILFEVNVDAEQQTRKIETMELIENIF